VPTYDYRCESGHRYEKREHFGSPAQQPCERCSKPAQRVLTSPTIVFKGSGWYKTDSRGGRTSKSASASDRDSAEGEQKAAAKADTESTTDGKTKSKTATEGKSGGKATTRTAGKGTTAAKSSASTNGASGSSSTKSSTKRSSD